MKKRKLGSKNPKYKTTQEKGKEKVVIKRTLMCKAKIRNASGNDTGLTSDVHGVWYK